MFKPTPTPEETQALWEQVRQALGRKRLFIENNTEVYYEEMLQKFPSIMNALQDEAVGTLPDKNVA